MANKISNVPYDQIPHIVLKHPETNTDDLSIMTCLFKVLKDKTLQPYSNESLSINSKVPIRTLKRRLKKLEIFGFISVTGFSYARRFSLGILFNTCAKIDVLELDTRAKSACTRAKSDIDPGHHGPDTKPYNNHSSKENYSFLYLKHLEQKEIEICLENNWPLSDEFKYLQKQLEEKKNND